MNKKIAR